MTSTLQWLMSLSPAQFFHRDEGEAKSPLTFGDELCSGGNVQFRSA